MRRVVWLVVMGCGGGAEPAGADDPAAVTWQRDVRAVVEARCVNCHVEGGLAPFALAWPDGEDRPFWTAAAVRAVQERRMPPWPAASDCHPIAGSRALADAEIALFTEWEDGGFVQGDPADYVAPVVLPRSEPDGEPDLVLTFAEPYTPKVLLPDDYHCLVLGPPAPADSWVVASRIVPGDTTVVHHAIAYLVGPDAVPSTLALDAGQDGDGYSCFGGPVTADMAASASTFAGYVPGQMPEVLLPGDARPIPAGSILVMQMHYNTLSAQGAMPADDTRLELWTRPGPPDRVVQTTAVADFDFLIPAGAPSYTSTVETAFGVSVPVLSTLGHMHTRGTRLTVEAVHPDGSTSCMLDLPRWDFAWQLTYSFPGDDPFVLGAEDRVRVTCTWDNSVSNQPVVDGVALEPQDLTWGEGTTDEMCIAYASYAVPYALTLGCEPLMACHQDGCTQGDGACLVSCWEDTLSPCGTCVAEGILACGQDSCPGPGLLLAACVDQRCPGTDLVSCLAGPCRSDLESYLSCQDAHVRDGACDSWLTGCGVAFMP